MPDQYVTTLVLVLVVGLLLSSVLVSPRFQKWYDQKKTDKRRNNAHAGKVMCESPGCTDVAIMLTPNGYFCDWDWEPMSRKRLEGGGFVEYNHTLNHAIRRA